MSLLCVAVKKARLFGNAGQFNSYVTLKLQNVKSTTVAVKGNNPCWEQDFIFETNRMDTGLVMEVWNKGVLWDKLLGCHWLPLLNIQFSNEEGEGKWMSLDAELVMKEGEVVATKNPTGSTILVDARFELPSDLQNDEAMELQLKLEVLNTIMDQEIMTLKEQARRAALSTHCMSEDSDYTSDVNYPVGHHPNSSASQFRGNPALVSEFSEDQSRQNSYEREYSYDDYNDGLRSDTESEPLYYNSRPRDRDRDADGDMDLENDRARVGLRRGSSPSPPSPTVRRSRDRLSVDSPDEESPVARRPSRYSSANVSRQSTQDFASDEYLPGDYDEDYRDYRDHRDRADGPIIPEWHPGGSRRPSPSTDRSGRRPSLERQSSFDQAPHPCDVDLEERDYVNKPHRHSRTGSSYWERDHDRELDRDSFEDPYRGDFRRWSRDEEDLPVVVPGRRHVPASYRDYWVRDHDEPVEDHLVAAVDGDFAEAAIGRPDLLDRSDLGVEDVSRRRDLDVMTPIDTSMGLGDVVVTEPKADLPRMTPRMRWLSAFNKICAQLNSVSSSFFISIFV